jgi:hypothetical protein
MKITNSACKHISIAAEIFRFMKVGINYTQQIQIKEAIPYLLLAIDPYLQTFHYSDKALAVQHPWLLYSRYRFRICTSQYLILPAQEEEMAHMYDFIASALLDLMKHTINEPDVQFHNVECCHMAFELGQYSMIVGQYQTAKHYFGLSESFLDGLSAVDLSLLTEIDRSELSALHNICVEMTQAFNANDPITSINIIDQLHTHLRYKDPTALKIVSVDIVAKIMAVDMKESLAVSAIKSGYLDIGLFILFCNVFHLASLMEMDFDVMKRAFYDVIDDDLFKEIGVELILKVLDVLSNTVLFKSFTQQFAKEFKLRISVFLFDLCDNLEFKVKSAVLSSSKIYLTQLSWNIFLLNIHC